MQSIPRVFALVCLASALSACGGSEPEPKEPSTEATPPAAEAAPKADKTDEATDEEKGGDKAEGDKGDKPAKEEAAAEPESKPTKSLKDVLTTPGALFMFSFTASDVHQAAEEKCSKSAKDDLKKKAQCMTKAGEKLEGDAFQFQDKGDNKGLWLTLHRKGDKLTTKHKVEVEFGKESGDKITLTPKTGNEVTIEVPSEGQIVIDDPKLGKMVYELKLGLIGEQER